jgi:hypothetical protein
MIRGLIDNTAIYIYIFCVCECIMPAVTDIYQQLHSLRVELKELKYLLLVTSISNGKEGEDQTRMLRCWEAISSMSVGQAEGEGKAQVQAKAET